MLKIENVYFAYAKEYILKDVSMNVGKGDFVAILGSNGAGKSTLIKIASGYIKAQKGSVELNGKNIYEISPRKLALSRAVLEQDTNLEFNYTVLDTVCLGRFALSGFFGLNARSKYIAELAISKVGLTGFETKQYLELSGGERRRVQLARVLAQILESPEGKLLLLDEPTANLDPKHSFETMKICKELTTMGTTCVAVVHSIEHAMNFAGKTAMISQNTLTHFGKTSQVLTEENISTLFDMNCKIIGDNIKTALLY